ncbi:glycosyltransferase [Nocardioides speluncae]|uniref:glycosyltransferase n=1 Tax=Nocardioides speluncae TaxID=2670337 RepID=UPI001F0BF8E5|nr:glycosyltransferase [Nocardioides speluncae]
MRIAQLANFIGPASGGMKVAVNALGEGYVAAGAQRLLVIPGPYDARTSTPAGDVVQLRAPMFGSSYRLIVEPWRVTEVLEQFRPTSVEFNDKLTLVPVARWARRNGIGSLLLSHERMDHMFAMRSGFETSAKVSIKLLNRVLVRSFDTIVTTSEYAREEFRIPAAAVGCPILRVPLGVDLETFRPVAGGTSEVLRLVHFGRLSREKSPHLAVATAVALHRRGVPLRLDVYGEGPHRDELEEIAGGAPVVFHGHVDSREELSRRIAEADISLSVCPSETFGLAVLEALASGTPVVTASVGGARELVDEESGAWAAPEPEALADAVLELAARPEAARRVAARRRAEQFPWHRTIDSMLALHSELASSAPYARPRALDA